MYSHEFKAEPTEVLNNAELRNVFLRFKAHLAEKGMTEVTDPRQKNGDHAAFVLGGGKSGLLRQPFEEYLELSYSSSNGFVLRIVRIIDHPVDFSDQYIQEFKTKTEQLIHEATSKNVQLHASQNHP